MDIHNNLRQIAGIKGMGIDKVAVINTVAVYSRYNRLMTPRELGQTCAELGFGYANPYYDPDEAVAFLDYWIGYQQSI